MTPPKKDTSPNEQANAVLPGANYNRGDCPKRVLVVEDSTTQATYLQNLLESHGLCVICALNGRMGLRLAQQSHPDLILLDVQMPEMNGFEVCEALKASPDTDDIPVIMFTRHDDPEAVQMGMKYGVVDYIPKDAFANAVLIETLRQMEFITD